MEMECCGNCRFSHKYIEQPDCAQCRRFPPMVAFDTGKGYFENAYPTVGVEHWCGEWKAVE